MISIELISRGEKTLRAVLDSIRSQDYPDYEVICVDSASGSSVRGLLREYGVTHVELPGAALLQARMAAHGIAHGDYSLLLDSTKPLIPAALSTLWRRHQESDMTIVREITVGVGFWARQAQIHNAATERDFTRVAQESVAFLLPRWYRGELLTLAFDRIATKYHALLTKIGYGEHHLIFEECRGLGATADITKEALIIRNPDMTLQEIFEKYYRYGRSQVNLRTLHNSATNRFSSHLRLHKSMRDRLTTLPLVTSRGISFALGYATESIRRHFNPRGR